MLVLEGGDDNEDNEENNVAAIAAAPVAASPDPAKEVEKQEAERDIVIVDIAGDGKTIQSTMSFTMTWKDDETGRVHVGTFTAKRPSLGDLSRMAVMRAHMNGGEKVDANTDFLHEMMSDLHVVLTEFPEWWVPANFFTVSPLRQVWDHVRLWIDSFRNKRVGK